MKSKIKYLILGCILAVLAMTAIQGYFIYNTFILKQKEAQTLVRLELIKMEDKIGIVNLRDEWVSQMKHLIKNKSHKKLIDKDFPRFPEISKEVKNYIEHNAVLSEYNTAYIVTIKNAKLIDPNSLSPLIIKNKIWFGNGKLPDNPQTIHEMVTRDNGDADVIVKEFTTESQFSINDWQRSILGQMTGLLLFSLLLLCLLIFLFYFSIRGLIMQKKIADIQTDFINNITHEFNTPLATLGIAIRTIQEQTEKEDNKVVNHSVRIAGRQHQRLKKLIDQVIFNASGLENIPLKKEKTKMSVFLSQTVTDFHALYPAVKLDFVSEHEEADLFIDRFHFTTAVNNMLENAVKYGARNIQVMSFIKENNYIIQIEDDGIGIAEKEHHKIFDKFYRVEKGDIHNTKGLGLGLYYCQQIITAHEGRIEISSFSSKGSIFTIYLPLS
ncbi:signal transduction histidine kinase [Chryseobacterium sp. H1D6B]|uniref:sensor histidine kinase n=1 Tax=Chryseobacterium sp. H1D6B TaxID=2940588 RepID=UPI0015CDD2E7|nr:HAMP domain-containing sensor histidine kinase [Chryseobacterium sp. H1D6B]MDH6251980.1 signal transduction histidine kinase [Chryseobacterium sp. H1D6B]